MNTERLVDFILTQELLQEQKTLLALFLRDHPIEKFSPKHIEYILGGDLTDPEMIFTLVDWMVSSNKKEYKEKIAFVRKWSHAQKIFTKKESFTLP